MSENLKPKIFCRFPSPSTIGPTGSYGALHDSKKELSLNTDFTVEEGPTRSSFDAHLQESPDFQGYYPYISVALRTDENI